MATIEPNFESICINPNDDLVLYKKEIIRSRIEKFLYAICSLDTDDLPTPLSRIEELYNCLVTGGDIPTFTPLSRAEKFVMAMLGAYDVELLPTPISRSETLMKKIAIGDNNLDDIDNLQSRYEFLLAYIIKAGGFNGGSGDFYYKLTSLTSSFTTIYGTLDKPVKNAVLRGKTLVNLVGTYKHTISTVNKPIVWGQKRLFLTNIKPNTIYTLRAKITEVVKGNYGPRVQIFFSTYSIGEVNTTTSTSDTLIFESPAELSSDAHLRLIVTGSEAEATEVDFEILLLEGEHPDIKDIPFFDYMTSVKMPVLTTTGKNLFDESQAPEQLSWGNNVKKANVKENTTYVYSSSPYTGYVTFKFYDNNDNEIGQGISIASGTSFTTPPNTSYLKTHTSNTSLVQIEEGTQATSYEPFKSNILTCNEEVELRGIGDIKDELNLVTGELTQRVGEIMLNGDENWNSYGNQSNQVNTVAFKLSHTNHVSSWGTGLGYCDKLPFTNGDVVYGQDLEGVTTDANNIIVRVNKSKASSIDEFKAWLSNYNIRVVYPNKENVIKTVDLSTLDQDGKETELSTFDDITHVITSSEELIPTGEIDIARPIQFVDYSLDNGEATLYNTIDYPVKSAILKGNTKYRDIDTGDILDEFDETKNLKLISCKMPVLTTTGKNLFDISKCKPGITIDENGNEVTTPIETYYAYVEFIPINNEFTMSITSNNGSVPDNANGTRLRFYDENKNLVSSKWFSPGLFKESNGRKYRTISMNGAKYLKLNFNATGSQTDTTYEAIQTIQIEQGSTATSYEPFKSNILTVNEEVELRGIGDVKDELNLVTGELTQRIQERVFDGSENWIIGGTGTNYIMFRCENYTDMVKSSSAITCDKYAYNKIDNAASNLSVTYSTTTGKICIVTSQKDLSIDNFKAKLNTDKPTIQYQLADPIVKTVDLSIVDQDDDDVLLILENGEYIITENGDYINVNTKSKKTKLKTFDDITHVITSSEGLVPTGEITVATKNATDMVDASVMSLRMDDILNSQGTLEGSANAQSDDIDVAMLGTTDIYEQLL